MLFIFNGGITTIHIPSLKRHINLSLTFNIYILALNYKKGNSRNVKEASTISNFLILYVYKAALAQRAALSWYALFRSLFAPFNIEN